MIELQMAAEYSKPDVTGAISLIARSVVYSVNVWLALYDQYERDTRARAKKKTASEAVAVRYLARQSFILSDSG